MMVYGIVGNRTGFTYNQVQAKLQKHNITADDTIITGGAKGVDTHAQRYAQEIGATLIIFYPNPNVNSPQRYFDRNIKIAEYIDELIAFNKKDWSGTTHTINESRKLDVKVTIYGDE